MNFLAKFTRPSSLWTSSLYSGFGISNMLLILFSFCSIHLLLTCDQGRLIQFLWTCIPIFYAFSKHLIKHLLWSSSLCPHISISSISVSTCDVPSKLWLILLWKTSCADCTPYGNLVNWYLPNGLLNVVGLMFSSSFVNSLAALNLLAISSNVWSC